MALAFLSSVDSRYIWKIDIWHKSMQYYEYFVKKIGIIVFFIVFQVSLNYWSQGITMAIVQFYEV